jgi:hypothetical protein
MKRRQLAYLAAALTLGLGLLGLLNPALTVRLLGLEVVDPRGFSQARATFGAMYLALGGVIVWAVSARGAHPVYLRLPGLLIGALALGRLLSIVIDGVVTPLNLLFFVMEGASAAFVMLASFDRGGSDLSAPTTSGLTPPGSTPPGPTV